MVCDTNFFHGAFFDTIMVVVVIHFELLPSMPVALCSYKPLTPRIQFLFFERFNLTTSVFPVTFVSLRDSFHRAHHRSSGRLNPWPT
ncbi:hypothetical protein CEXT_606961 [Caerostris extrusa]|uniref:Secreted protein n=1 Tax=Caerostris extrusa TaxID=172846 RepID=A0AAV4UQ80_CAEEX|nr:hypothetical protein CEXT_606961 [Caerostris extrusa]